MLIINCALGSTHILVSKTDNISFGQFCVSACVDARVCLVVLRQEDLRFVVDAEV